MPFKESKWMTSGGSVDENLPVSAGDTCSIPGLGRAHVPRGSQASGPRALEAVRLELGATVRSPWTMVKNSPYLPQSEKASTQPQRPGAAKNKYINDFLKALKKKKRKVSGIPRDITAAETAWVFSQAQIALPVIKSLNVLHRGTLNTSRISLALQEPVKS